MRRKFAMRRPTANRDQAIILTLLDSGLRASEFSSLRIGDFDAKRGKLEIRHGVEGGAKGGKGRVVYLGERMQEMLKGLAGQDGLSPEIRVILAAFPQAESRKIALPPVSTALVEPLTTREYEILKLLSQRMRNKQISQKLNIPLGTVKRHVINLSGKLDVNRREDAVAQAAALGLIALPKPALLQL
jgi:ATP/maltotriose-dependent transcriptional regulator MalT